MRDAHPIALISLLCSLAAPALAADAPPAQEKTLDRLVGDWTVTGTIRGNPIAQTLHVRRTLAGRFVELHFKGDEPMGKGKPAYEARVFIGWDARAKRFVGHWLDVFGAGASEPVGHGRLEGGALVMVYPYPSAHFRNTFRFDARKRTWRLHIERRKGDGTWSTFADETFKPAQGRGARPGRSRKAK